MTDATGAFYGTTSAGGSNGTGTVFRLRSVGNRYKKKTLYSFLGFSDGQDPLGALIEDSSGALYGTTYNGGVNNATGTVFKLTPSGSGYTKTTIYTFQGGSDGSNPDGALVAYQGGFYGTTIAGGKFGDGTVFALKPTTSGYAETVVHSFQGGQDGATPRSALLVNAGNLFSTTLTGGGGPCALTSEPAGCGTVFELKPSGSGFTETVVYRFKGGMDGANPYGGLISDSRGTLYGTTGNGGSNGCRGGDNGVGCGTLFKLSPAGSGYTESILHRFMESDGRGPVGTLTAASHGKFYGTTLLGGAVGQGTVFALTVTPHRLVFTSLYSFQSTTKSDGSNPVGGLIFGADGKLFGTTQSGGSANNGTVFSFVP
ncbi:MAG: hypothetical protein JO190_00830 [Candidatus Eremiobacteraeota bacterium]|nr:hypothetical protein [Candidatus Eremiobacteraeota bacterium]MBV8500072.1 hypothetical protein [Candidatus Eremiobacteraeota bacterium]